MSLARILSLFVSFAIAVAAEVIEVTGSAEVSVERFTNGQLTASAAAAETSANGADPLPLQPAAALSGEDADAPSAAAAAAQFADPLLDQANPEEFAVNLTCNSVSDAVTFRASGFSSEIRRVVFSPAELGLPGSSLGQSADFTGRLLLDGALALIARDPDRDLTGAAVNVSVTVRQTRSGGSTTLFEGSLTLRGDGTGAPAVEADGDFPTRALILTDLSSLTLDLETFWLLVIPDITISYDYTAVVGEEFTLEASISVGVANVAGDAGAAAVIGTPTDTLSQVISVTQGEATASKVIEAIARERDDPTGDAAFPDSGATGLCGLFGFEMALALAALPLMRRRFR